MIPIKRTYLASLLVLALTVAYSQEVHRNYLDGHLYVKLTRQAARHLTTDTEPVVAATNLPFLKAIAEKYGITRITRPFAVATDSEILPLIIRIQFADKFKVAQLISDLERSEMVDYAERVPLPTTHATPNDYSTSPASVHLNQINAQAAWNYFNGNSNITVAIIDNATMWSHVDLIANTYTNTGEIAGNNVDDDGNGFIDDVNGFDVADWDNDAQPTNVNMSHGTMCAGIAGGRTDNSIGIASIGWNLKIIPVKCETNSGGTTTVSYGYEGIVYASRARARVISCSWGSSTSAATEVAVINYAWNRGSIIVASAGNSFGTSVNYPAAYPNVYAVAAVMPNDVKVGMSTYGTWVDISAPGDNIYSTAPSSGMPNYGYGTGTSMAAPMVAGLAGLMLSKSPHMTRQDVLNCISSTAVNIYTLSGNATYSNQLGAGRIDAAAAMACAAGYSVQPPLANFTAFMRQTCPNTPVQFTDSSLYLPTAFSWTFQGGTPATSTQSNPVVQWSTPGTYSVVLTVTNAHGSDTETKTGFIHVSGPISPPLAEGFESPSFLPAGWSSRNIMNDSMYWQRVTGIGGFGTSTACAVFNNYDNPVEGERDEMLTPKYSFTNVAIARLRFDVAYARYDASNTDTLEVKMSTNCGVSWSSIYVKGGSQLATAADNTNPFVPSSTQWRTDTIDITATAAGQGNVMFSFVNRGHYGQNIYLDNINLFFPTPTLSIAHSTAACAGGGISFSNSTTGAAQYSWTTGTGIPASSTATSPVISFTSAGTHTILITATNGTTTASETKTIQVFTIPTVAVSNVSLCSGHSATLTATGASTYSWSTGESGSAITVTPVSNTIYTVTGLNGGICSDTTQITVSVIQAPTVSAASQTICAGATATLWAAGAQSYTWTGQGQGAHIVVSPGSTTVYTLTGSDGTCIAAATTTVHVNNIPTTVISPTHSACGMVCRGIINAQTVGGTPPFQYQLTPSPCTSIPCTDLCPGQYTLTTTDANNCAQSSTVTILSALSLTAATTVTHTCAGCNTGSAEALAFGGYPPYQYAWSNGSTQQVNSNLAPGCYTLQVTDAALCTVTTVTCVEGSSALNEAAENIIKIYPNPAAGEVAIEMPGEFGLTIYNNLGQLIFEGGANGGTQVQTAGFARGSYLVRITKGNSLFYRKLLLE